MKWRANNQKGFTIVELLIVIVVVGILAAITITAFTGVQNQAEASKTANAISAYKERYYFIKPRKVVTRSLVPCVWVMITLLLAAKPLRRADTHLLL